MNVISVSSFSVLLLACGGGGGADAGSLSVQAPSLPAASPVVIPPVVTPPTVTPPVITPPVVIVPPVVTPPVNSGDVVITNVRIQNTDTVSRTQTNVPITFGHVFAPGDLPNANTLYGKLSDGTVVPLQVDVKAKHADGSVRHAIISSMLSSLPYNQTLAITLIKAASPTTPAAGAAPAALLAAGFTAGVNVTLNGQLYTASADALLKTGQVQSWLSGPLVNEWLVSAPLKNAQGNAHPHLTARFAIRSYTGLNKARVDVTLENNWAYEPNPQDFTYDAQIQVGAQTVYSKPALAHYNHTRWRKVYWWGTAPLANIQHNPAYLIASKALPNYDQSVVIAQSALADLAKQFTGAVTEPMGAGAARRTMPDTGGRPDLALLPGWATSYLLSMDKRAKDVTLGTADLAGSWSIHYRDKVTDRPISVKDYPYASMNARANAVDPATNKNYLFPALVGSSANPNVADSAHEPGFAYLPYLVTGDYYYLEELQFWAMYNMIQFAPGYRQYEQGLFQDDQVRGQAWSMRTLGEVAYITPDADILKSQLTGFLNYNLDWYNSQYTNNASANALGVIVNGYALNGGNFIAPWEDDFFTSAIGHIAEMGFSKANTLLSWKSKFPIGRMTDSGFCWIDASLYQLKITNNGTAPFYSTFAQAYQSTETSGLAALSCASSAMASFLGLKSGEMVGYAFSNTGYPSNLQPALAYAVNSGASNGAKAWAVFAARSVKPDYTTGAQFAIIPRQ